MKITTILAMLFLIAAPVWAADLESVEIEMNACLAKPESMSTQAMLGCMYAAQKDYDALLNQTYQRALAALDPKSAALLKAAEREWVAFRASEEAVYEGPWRADRGTIVLLNLANARVAALKERIAALQIYLPDQN